MNSVKKRAEVTFSKSPPSEKGLYRINVEIEVAGEKREGFIRGTFREDEVNAFLQKIGKGR